MNEDFTFECLVEEIEKSCQIIQQREDIQEINRADKLLFGIINSKSKKFCLDMAFKLLEKNRAISTKRFGAFLLYDSIRSSSNVAKYFNADQIKFETLINVLIEMDSIDILRNVSRSLCLLLFSPELPSSPIILLDIIINSMKNTNKYTNKVIIVFFTSIAQEYENIYPIFNSDPSYRKSIDQIVHKVQIECMRILNDSTSRYLHVSVLHCIESWIKILLEHHCIYFLILRNICELVLDEELSTTASNVVQSMLDCSSLFDFDTYGVLGSQLLKLLFYSFPYLSHVDSIKLNYLICESEIQRNVTTVFLSFANTLLSSEINSSIYESYPIFDDILQVIVRITAIGSVYSPPYIQTPDLILYPFQFWNDFFDEENSKITFKSVKIKNLFVELFHILYQKVMIYPRHPPDPEMNEILRQIRRESASIFRKMFLIFPDLLVEQIFQLYRIAVENCKLNPIKYYQLEAAIFCISIFIDSMPINSFNLSNLMEIFTSIPSLCNSNPENIKSCILLLSKSTKFIINHLPMVFDSTIMNIERFIYMLKDDPSATASDIISTCVEFVAKSVESINFKINDEIAFKIIKLFGTLFSQMLDKAKVQINFNSFLNNKQKKMHISMLKIITRTVYCMFLDGRPHEAETYLANLIKTVFLLFNIRLSASAQYHQPAITNDIYFLLRMLSELCHGSLIDSSSSKGTLKFIFEALFDTSTFLSCFYSLSSSETSHEYLRSIVGKCMYKGFGANVTQSSLNNFTNIMILLINENYWQLVTLVNTYVKAVYAESPINMIPIEYICLPIINIGISCLIDPQWEHSYHFFKFLTLIFDELPSNAILYNYISLENAQLLVMSSLDYSTAESDPNVCKQSVKLLKRIIRASCSDAVQDILLTSTLPDSDMTYLQHIVQYTLMRMFKIGSLSVILYHSLYIELSIQCTDIFLTVFYSVLLSPNVISEAIVDSDSRNIMYWQFIDNMNNKDISLDIFTKFFHSYSSKCKI